MRNLDTARLIKLVLAGAIAGFIVFLIYNPAMRAQEQAIQRLIRQMVSARSLSAALNALRKASKNESGLELRFTAVFAAMICALVMLADEIGAPVKRIGIKVLLAVLTGAIVGCIAGYLASAVYAALYNPFSLSPTNMLARMIAWALMGVGVGAGLGCALLSWRRAIACMIGGALGGAAGGLLFEVIAAVQGGNNGTISRLVGFIVVGAAVGAAVVWVEDLAKQSWVTLLSGAREGRSYILSKPITTIGRDELADIPLFGDPTVTKRHAELHLKCPRVLLQAEAGAPLAVNGVPTASAELKDFDTIHIGRHALRFHQKAGHRLAGVPILPQQPALLQQPSYPPQPTLYPQQPRQLTAAPAVITLAAVSGPHANQSFQFGPGLIKIGREPDSQICLSLDTMVSRRHAEIGWDGQNWHIRDAGSRNGLWINGARVSQTMLRPGDRIGVGQSVLAITV